MSRPAPSPAFIIEQRSEFLFAVLGPNPDAGKRCVSCSSDYLTVCTTDGRNEALMIAHALNAVGAQQQWLDGQGTDDPGPLEALAASLRAGDQVPA